MLGQGRVCTRHTPWNTRRKHNPNLPLTTQNGAQQPSIHTTTQENRGLQLHPHSDAQFEYSYSLHKATNCILLLLEPQKTTSQTCGNMGLWRSDKGLLAQREP